ncbi:MAG TPA: TrbG/VirB9 family P-type conjugative transfer protein [Lautropia sp.]|nr:TrbG/VirB9 family P-type conjugative transfer protein [Lautropia sp.]
MNRLTFQGLAAGMLCIALCTLSNGASAQAIQEYEYAENRIYQVRTGLGITTQIELSPNEKVLDFSTGFSAGWDLTRRDNVFYVKPKNIDVDTNMLIRTEANSYIFELKVVATDWTALDEAKRAGVQYKITFAYPNDASFAARKEPAAEPVAELSTALEKERLYNFGYDYSARTRQAWLIPTNVYDDGQFTYIRMSDLKTLPTGSFPAVFARERERGDDLVVNTTVENNTLVVHGTYPFLVIRHGKNVVGLRRNPQK